MARPLSKGLRYAPLDVSFLQDRKIRRLRRKKGGQAPLVFVALLCTIYSENYYIKWDDDLAFDIAELTGLDEKFVVDVVESCLEIGLLSKDMMDKYSILTSHGIQVQYQKICEQSKRKSGICEFSLLESSEETDSDCDNRDVSSEETNCDSQNHALPRNESNKLKESKLKESKDYYSCLEEEKEQIVLDFTFNKNWASPNAEYDKLVAFNNRPESKKKWNDMTAEEKQSVVVIWQQKPKKDPRFDGDFLSMWRTVYETLVENKASSRVRMAALADGVRWSGQRGGSFWLYVPEVLSQFIEENLDFFKPIILPFISERGCINLRYKKVQETQTNPIKL